MNMGTISEALKEFKALIIFLILLLLVGVGAWTAKDYYDNKLELLQGANSALTANLTTTENEVKSIENLLDSASEESKFLQSMIHNMEILPVEIRYVTRIKTIIEASEPEMVTIEIEKQCNLPVIPSHIYKWKNGLHVAQFDANIDNSNINLYHQTGEITFESTIINSADKSGIVLRAKSSLEPDTVYDIPITTLQTIEIRKHKLFEPHLALLLQGSVDVSPPGGDITAGISVPLIHLLENQLDFLAPKFTFNHENARAGLDIIGYNIGHDLPVINNTWLNLGTSIPLVTGTFYPSIDITISVKL